jgi:hypothetical protein
MLEEREIQVWRKTFFSMHDDVVLRWSSVALLVTGVLDYGTV